MPVTLSAEAFDRAAGDARRAAEDGPVVIVESGRPAQVLLSIAEYRRLTGKTRTIAELLALEDDIPFDPPRLDDLGFKPSDFD